MLVYIFFSALILSVVASILIIRYEHLHAHLSMDHDLDGVQKFHVTPTPRVGGVPVMLGLLAGTAVWCISAQVESVMPWLLLLASVPVFLAGLVEDLTKRVSPAKRLFAAFVSAGLGIWLLEAKLDLLGVPGLDALLQGWPLLAIFFTVFAVGGACHAVNIIDGYNGLMAGVGILVSLAYAYVAAELGDLPLQAVSLMLAASILGFMIWNFPKGLIFAGDAGAYLIGFMLAEVAVLIIARHPGKMTAWFPLLVMLYPVFETVFTIYRRKMRKAAAGLPDSMHFHQIIYKRLVRWMVGRSEAEHLLRRNSLTAPYLWAMAFLTVMPAVLFWNKPVILQFFCVLFVVSYVVLYRRIVRFRSPKWLVLRKSSVKKRTFQPVRK